MGFGILVMFEVLGELGLISMLRKSCVPWMVWVSGHLEMLAIFSMRAIACILFFVSLRESLLSMKRCLKNEGNNKEDGLLACLGLWQICFLVLLWRTWTGVYWTDTVVDRNGEIYFREYTQEGLDLLEHIDFMSAYVKKIADDLLLVLFAVMKIFYYYMFVESSWLVTISFRIPLVSWILYPIYQDCLAFFLVGQQKDEPKRVEPEKDESEKDESEKDEFEKAESEKVESEKDESRKKDAIDC